MLTGNLARPSCYQSFHLTGVLSQSLDWVREHGSTHPEGIHELGEPGWYVNVHGYTTQATEQCTWENHTETIDLQFWIQGQEAVDVIDVAVLGEPTVFKPASDTQKFAAVAAASTRLVLGAGDFAFFFPGEAHRPKVAVGEPGLIRKLVVKIPVRLLG